MVYNSSLRDLRKYLRDARNEKDTLTLEYLSALINTSIIDGTNINQIYRTFDKYAPRELIRLRKRIFKRMHEEESKQRAKPSKLAQTLA